MFTENARYSAQKRKTLDLLKLSQCLNGRQEQAFMNKAKDYQLHSFYRLGKKRKQNYFRSRFFLLFFFFLFVIHRGSWAWTKLKTPSRGTWVGREWAPEETSRQDHPLVTVNRFFRSSTSKNQHRASSRILVTVKIQLHHLVWKRSQVHLIIVILKCQTSLRQDV